MSDRKANLFVITGGPGSGKTALIEALNNLGYRTCPEVGRQIIREQQLVSGPALPWGDPALYAEVMLSWQMKSHHLAADSEEGAAFFDRGIPDIIGYLRLLDLPVPGHMTNAARMLTFGKKVFICPPWRDIYRQDKERKQSFETAVRTYQFMAETYAGFGYHLLTVPVGPVRERIGFILDASIGAGST